MVGGNRREEEGGGGREEWVAKEGFKRKDKVGGGQTKEGRAMGRGS